mmetsp:Transcript_1061/g.3125  ORF Transcript_1061/g.3125 Transcript_1061/m.3125 type:complete len:193 (-) Transcript_1061:116-694(-)
MGDGPTGTSARMNREKPTRVVKSCAGLTYFTSAMRAAGKPPMCLGRRGTVSNETNELPHKEVIERSAKSVEQKGNVDFTYACLGYSQTTAKMEREGALPLCDVGVRLTMLRAAQKEAQPKEAPAAAFDLKAWLTRVSTSVLNFWRKALDDYPNKWLNFNKKLYTAMNRQAKFIGKLLSKVSRDALSWWLSRP